MLSRVSMIHSPPLFREHSYYRYWCSAPWFEQFPLYPCSQEVSIGHVTCLRPGSRHSGNGHSLQGAYIPVWKQKVSKHKCPLPISKGRVVLVTYHRSLGPSSLLRLIFFICEMGIIIRLVYRIFFFKRINWVLQKYPEVVRNITNLRVKYGLHIHKAKKACGSMGNGNRMWSVREFGSNGERVSLALLQRGLVFSDAAEDCRTEYFVRTVKVTLQSNGRIIFF